MSIQKRRDKKKKDREKNSKLRVLKRRTVIREKRKLEQAERQKEAELQEIVHGKLKPIVTDATKLEALENAKQKAAMEKLQKNMQILEALEQEYEAEQALRNQINNNLENEGHMTLKEKMDALHEKALEQTGIKKDFEDALEAEKNIS